MHSKYCQERFERDDGLQQIVCWRKDRHPHDSALQSSILHWLEHERFPGTSWRATAGTLQANLEHPAPEAIEY